MWDPWRPGKKKRPRRKEEFRAARRDQGDTVRHGRQG